MVSLLCSLTAIHQLLSMLLQVASLDTAELLAGGWQDGCLLLVMPGGADLPYCKVLNGRGNALIRGGGAGTGSGGGSGRMPPCCGLPACPQSPHPGACCCTCTCRVCGGRRRLPGPLRGRLLCLFTSGV